MALHHSLLAHGYSVKALRDKAKKIIKVGPVNTGSIAYPADDVSANISAAYQATFNVFGSEEDKHDHHHGIAQLIHYGILPGILILYFSGIILNKA